MLKHGKLVPEIERDDRLQRRRQVFSLAQHATPLLKPRVFVPVEIIDERVLFGRGAGAAGPSGALDRRL
ncbi:hypothetical protein D3C87_2173110 [compost metagenome]